MTSFFVFTDAVDVIHGVYDPALVAVSFLIAVFSSAMALQVTALATGIRQSALKRVMLFSGSLALGCGIWSMHFIGMLAFSIGTRVSYDPVVTAMSMIPSVAASWVALDLIGRRSVRRSQLIGGGVLVGAGIGSMHYTGMLAMKMEATLRYDPLMFLGSIVVAVLLAMLALWVRFSLRRYEISDTRRTFIASMVMGAAISGMHYMGMSAARFIPPEDFVPHADDGLISLLMTGIIVVITFAVTASVIVINLLLKYRDAHRRASVNAQRMVALMDTAVDGIVIINASGTIVSVNSAIENMFGYPAAELIGEQAVRLMPDKFDVGDRDISLADYLSSRHSKFVGQGHDTTVVRKDGQVVHVRLAIGHAELPDGDMFIGFLTDVSERKALETALIEAKDKAEAAAAARTAFLANMSHEIRTPMNAIIGFSDHLLDSEMSSDQRRHVNTIHSSAVSLLHLLNDILDSAKLEKGKVGLESVDFSLPETLDLVTSTLWVQARKKELSLAVNLDPDLPEFFVGDPSRLGQVLTNLVGNAIKFTEKGGVTTSVSQTFDGLLRFEVMDTGIGISPERLPLIFDAFTQEDDSISRRYGGTGLGTTISQQLVELMGGEIGVTSEPGKGSCFWFTLPLKEGKFTESKNRHDIPTLPPLNVLVADDIPQNTDLLKVRLGATGHQVTIATNGREALEIYKTLKPDIVLMDVHMPEMDGLSACREIRAWEEREGINPCPVVALTASVMEEDKRDAAAAGMQGFATKPVDFALLVSEMARVLNIRVSAPSPVADEHVSDDQVLDVAKGLKIWGQMGLYATQLQDFIQRYGDLPSRMGVLLQLNNLQEVQHLAHAAKGVAANLAVNPVRHSCGEIEQACRRQDGDAAMKAAEQLRDRWPMIMSVCKSHVGQNRESVSADSSGDLLGLLKKLAGTLSDHDYDDDVLDQLQAYTGKHGKEVLDIVTAVNDFEFDDAAGKVSALVSVLEVTTAEA